MSALLTELKYFHFFVLVAVTCGQNLSDLGPTRYDMIHYLLDERRYDPSLPPEFYTENITTVSVELSIFDLNSESDIAMEFECTLYLRMNWTDKRLDYTANKTTYDVLDLGDAIVDKVWIPDLYFHHSRKTEMHGLFTKNQLLYIYRNGSVLYSGRLNIRWHCPMNLTSYPFDEPKCTITIQSYSLNKDYLILKWNEGKAVWIESDVKYLKTSNTTEKHSYHSPYTNPVGNFSTLEAVLLLPRPTQSLVIIYIVPPILFFSESLTCFFWGEEVGPRITVTFLALLQVILQCTGIYFNKVPATSELRKVDYWMFANLLFLATVFFVNAWICHFVIKKKQEEKEKADKEKKTNKEDGGEIKQQNLVAREDERVMTERAMERSTNDVVETNQLHLDATTDALEEDPTEDPPSVNNENRPPVSTEDGPSVSIEGRSSVSTVSTGIRPSVSTEDMQSVSTEHRPSVCTEDRPHVSTEDRPSVTTEDRPSEISEDRPPSESTEDMPSVSTENRPPVSTEDRASESTEDMPLMSTEDRPPVSTEDRPSESTEDMPSVSTANRPSVSTEDMPPVSTEDRPSVSTEDRPSVSTEDMPSVSTAHRPSVSTEDRPPVITEDRPSVTTEDRPSESYEDRPSENTEDRPSVSTENRPSIEDRPSESTEDGASVSTEDRPHERTEDMPSKSTETRPSTELRTPRHHHVINVEMVARGAETEPSENELKKDFRQLLREYLEQNSFKASTEWEHAKKKVKDEPRYKAAFQRDRAEPWYREFMKEENKLKELKEDFLQILKDNNCITTSTNWETAEKIMENDPRYKRACEIYEVSQWYKEYIDKKAKEGFRTLLKEKASTIKTWERAEMIIDHDPRYEAVVNKNDRKQLFEEYWSENCLQCCCKTSKTNWKKKCSCCTRRSRCCTRCSRYCTRRFCCCTPCIRCTRCCTRFCSCNVLFCALLGLSYGIFVTYFLISWTKGGD